MKNKRTLIISIFIIIVLIMVILGLGWYIQSQQNTSNEDTSINADIEDESNIIDNTNISEEISVNNNTDIPEEIAVNDNILKSLISKFDFSTYATASIYKVGSFNLDSIPNDLILRLGWSKIDSSNKSISVDYLKETVTSSVMEQSITNVFGSKVKYTNDSFICVDVDTFHGYGGYSGSERNCKIC